MQEVGDFAGYFAKYLGKNEEAQAARDPIPGRWWGKVNKQNIPWAEMKELELPPPDADLLSKARPQSPAEESGRG